MRALETLARRSRRGRRARRRTIRCCACDGEDTTVGALQDRSRNVAAALRRWGVEPGDRTAIMMRNVPEFVSRLVRRRARGVHRGPGAHRAPRPAARAHPRRVGRARALLRRRVRRPPRGARRCRRSSGSCPRRRRDARRPRVGASQSLAEALPAAAPADGPALAGDTRLLHPLHVRDDRPVEGRRADPQREPRAREGQPRADGVHGRRRPLHGVPAVPRQREVHLGHLGDDRRRPAGARRRASAPRASGTGCARRASPPFNYMGGLLSILAKQPRAARRPRPPGHARLRRRVPAARSGSRSRTASACACTSTTA